MMTTETGPMTTKDGPWKGAGGSDGGTAAGHRDEEDAYEGAELLEPFVKGSCVTMVRGRVVKEFLDHIEREYGIEALAGAIAHVETCTGRAVPRLEKNGWYRLDIMVFAVDHLRKIDGPRKWDWGYFRRILYGSIMSSVIPFLRFYLQAVGIDRAFERVSEVWPGMINAGSLFVIRLKDRERPTFVCRVIYFNTRSVAPCNIAMAVMEALAHKLTGKRPDIVETKCIDKGDVFCEFEMVLAD